MSAPSSPGEARRWIALRRWLAWLNGDTAYAAYLAHLHARHPECTPPSRAEFHRQEIERRWNGVRRCC